MVCPLWLRTAGLTLLALLVFAMPLSVAPMSMARPALTVTDRVVREARISDDQIFYLADYDQQGQFALYRAPLLGGAPIHMANGLPAGSVERFVVTPTGAVVFLFRCDASGTRLLFSIPTRGAPLTLLGPAASCSYANSQLIFGLSPSGDRVVYMADRSQPNAFELFSVAVSGGPTVKLNLPLPGMGSDRPGQVTSFVFTPDGQHVVYRALAVVGTLAGKLYSVSVLGGSSQLLANELEHDNQLITSDGRTVVYATANELRAVPRDAGGPSTLIATGHNIHFALTRNGGRVVYVRQDSTTFATTLHSAPLDGNAGVQIAADVRYAAQFTFALTPDTTGVLYNNAAEHELLLAPVVGGAPQTLSPTLVFPQNVHFSADGTRAIFVAGTDAARALYSLPLSGGPALRLDDPALSAGGLLLFSGVLHAGRAIYMAAPGTLSGGLRLYSVPLEGGPSTQLAGDLGVGQELIHVCAVGEGMVLFMSGNLPSSAPTAWHYLYAVPADGTAAAHLVHPVASSGWQVYLPLVHQP